MSKEKILIIGLRKEHVLILQQKFKDTHDINCLDSQANHARRLKNTNNYSKIITCTKFTNHSTERLYNKHKGYTRISGGRTSVSNFLETNVQLGYRYS